MGLSPRHSGDQSFEGGTELTLRTNNLPLTFGAEGAPGTFAPLADDATAFTGATTTGAGAALATSFLTGFVLTTGTSSSLSESRAAKLFMAC